ncbi:MAG: tetratricopeptide repeat protein [Desulfobulbaceae bacterium]|nr:MAG: tetratricopeptide repeat protein [Desulfobulbaceae bacterium]
MSDKWFDKLRHLFRKSPDTQRNSEGNICFDSRHGAEITTRDVVAGNKFSGSSINYGTISNVTNNVHLAPSGHDQSFFVGDIDADDSADDYRIKEAEIKQRLWKLDEAIDLYVEILSDKPPLKTTFLSYINLTICYLLLSETPGNIYLARKCFESARKNIFKPQEEKLYYTKAFLLFALGDENIGEALEYLNQALNINPEYVRAINLKASLLEEKKTPITDVLNELYFDENGDLLKIHQDDMGSLKNVGHLYSKKGDFDSALDIFHKALAIREDDAVLHCFIGDAHLFKALGSGVDSDIVLSEDGVQELSLAVKFYRSGNELYKGGQYPKDLNYFITNYTAALCLIGKHREAYEKAQYGLKLGVDHEELFLNKARLETIFGNYEDAHESFDKISDENRLFERANIFLSEGRSDDCIKFLHQLMESQDNDSEIFANCEDLLVEAYLQKDSLDKVSGLLLKVGRERRDTWRTKLGWARYYDKTSEWNRCEEFALIAIQESDRHPGCVVDVVNIYGRNEQFGKIILLLQSIIDEERCSQTSYAAFVYRNLAKAQLFDGRYHEVIKSAEKAKEVNVYEDEIGNLQLEAYLKIGDYTNAKSVAKALYRNHQDDYHLIYTLGALHIATWDLENGKKFLEQCLGINDQDVRVLITLGQTYFLEGDCNKSLEFARLAKDIDVSDPSSQAHSFFIQLHMLCGEVDLSAKYMHEFHNDFPDQQIVHVFGSEHTETGETKIPNELAEILQERATNFKTALDLYRNNSLPLTFLAKTFNLAVSVVYDWRRYYDLKINIEDGNPKVVFEETKNVLSFDKIILDYLSLLIFARLGLLNEILDEFKGIYVSHRTLEEITSSIVVQNDFMSREIFNALRFSPKVIYFSPESTLNVIEEEVVDVFTQSVEESLVYALEQDMPICFGDVKVRNYAKQKGKFISSGPVAMLHRLAGKNRISLADLARKKSILMAESHDFITFTSKEMFALASKNNFILTDELKQYFDYCLKIDPDVDSFCDVYINLFTMLNKKGVSFESLTEWMKYYVSTFCKLSFKDTMKSYWNPYLKSQKSGEVIRYSRAEYALFYLFVFVEVVFAGQQVKNYLIRSFLYEINHAPLLISCNSLRRKAIELAPKVIEQGSIGVNQKQIK